MKSRRDAKRVGCRHIRQSRDESSPRASPRIRRPRPRPRRSATPPTIESNRIESNRSRSPILKQDGRRWTDGDLASIIASTIVVARARASHRIASPRRTSSSIPAMDASPASRYAAHPPRSIVVIDRIDRSNRPSVASARAGEKGAAARRARTHRRVTTRQSYV